MIILIDFDLISDIFFHAHPVEEEFHEDSDVVFAEKLIIL